MRHVITVSRLRKFQLGKGGQQVLYLLARMARAARHSRDATWLISYRAQIRQIERIHATAVLTHVIEQTPDRRLRILAIWLRGRCGGTLGRSAVAEFRNTSDWTLRKEVARCLKRLSAWSDLRAMSERESDPRIARMTAQAAPKSYAVRLDRFASHLESQPVPPNETPLRTVAELESGQGRPPKPRWLIRGLLAHIHQLVVATDRRCKGNKPARK